MPNTFPIAGGALSLAVRFVWTELVSFHRALDHMKPSVFMHFCWALIAVVAFVAGFFIADLPKREASSEPIFTVVSAASRPTIDAERVEIVKGPAVAEAFPIAKPLTGAAACGRIMEALREPSRTARMRMVAETLGQIRAENWRDVVSAWSKLVYTRGPITEGEWDLMLERVGEVAGKDAMANALELKTSDTLSGLADHLASAVLRGWAVSKPKEAVEWYRTHPNHSREQLAEALMTGLGRSDPREALAVAAQQAVPAWPDRIRLILENANQAEGLRAAEEMLADERFQAPELFKTVLFEQLTNRRAGMWTVRNSNPHEALLWLEAYVGQSFVGSRALGSAIDFAVRDNGTEVLKWLDERADRLTPGQAEAAYNALGKSWHDRQREQFLAWVKVNASHPRLGPIVALTTAAEAKR